MIARPKISQNERKRTELGAFEVGHFAPFSGPGVHQIRDGALAGDVAGLDAGELGRVDGPRRVAGAAETLLGGAAARSDPLLSCARGRPRFLLASPSIRSSSST